MVVTLFGIVGVGSCGGQVADRSGNSGGTSTGGTTSGGGVSTGGASTGGSGTGAAAAMGGISGTGGTTVRCPPIASCNWCGGATIYDADGCIAGWQCANGVDPCQVPPCEIDCPPGHTCGADMLCWPETEPPTCSSKECDDKPWDCACKWSCSNGSYYSFECTIASDYTECLCMQNNLVVDGCKYTSSDGGSSNACPIGDSCCKTLPQ